MLATGCQGTEQQESLKKERKKKHKAFTILPGLNVLQQDSECFCFLLEDTTSESGENQSLTFISTILFPVMEKSLEIGLFKTLNAH